MCLMLSIRMARSLAYAKVVFGIFGDVWNFIPFDLFLAIRGVVREIS